MKKLISAYILGYIMLLVIALLFSSCAKSQTNIKTDSKGNYIAVKSSHKDSASYKETGKTFTDTKGNTYPVYISVNGKLFIIRTSKNGNQYKQYLKLS